MARKNKNASNTATATAVLEQPVVEQINPTSTEVALVVTNEPVDAAVEVTAKIDEPEFQVLDAPAVGNVFSGLGQRVVESEVVDVEPKESTTKTDAPAVVTTSTNKASLARVVFEECYKMSPVPQRKDIINRAMKEAGLTKAGAATYLQNYKAKNGLTHQK